MRIEGKIRIGEAAPWARRAESRLEGPRSTVPALYALNLGAVLLGAAAGALLSRGLHFLAEPPSWTAVVLILGGIAAGGLAGQRLCRAFALRQYRRALAARGIPLELDNAVEITPEALAVHLHGSESRYPWPVVSDLFPCGPYWAFVAMGRTEFLPRRRFATAAEEKAFIAEALGRMTPEARARSREAEAFADHAAAKT